MIIEFNVSEFHQGRQVVETMGVSKPGAWTGQVLARVIEWQLEHPDGTRTECEAWLKAEHGAGRVCLEQNTVQGSGGKRVKVNADGSVTKKAKI